MKSRSAPDPGSGLGGNWLVIVRNDDHNTFEHVARTLARCIPGVDYGKGMAFANRSTAAARRSSGPGQREPAEHYWEQLASAGLTMAPLEQA